jgi:hypothetical protein
MGGIIPVKSLDLIPGKRYPITNTAGSSGYPITLVYVCKQGNHLLFDNGKRHVVVEPFLSVNNNVVSICLRTMENKENV